MIKSAIFDFDGTLFDSGPYWEDVMTSYLRAQGAPPPPNCMMLVKPVGVKAGTAFFAEKYSLPEDPADIAVKWRSRMGDFYRNEVPLKEGSAAFLQDLRNRGISLGLATAMEREFVEAALKRTGADTLFDYVITIADLQCDKTGPTIFLHCAERFNSRPHECLVFEDSPEAANVCKTAGFPVVGLYDGTCEEEYDRIQPYCMQRARTFTELLPVLDFLLE